VRNLGRQTESPKAGIGKGTASQAAEKSRFWVVQRFQRCDNRTGMNKGGNPGGSKDVFFRSLFSRTDLAKENAGARNVNETPERPCMVPSLRFGMTRLGRDGRIRIS
jgi:hypothetical protein